MNSNGNKSEHGCELSFMLSELGRNSKHRVSLLTGGDDASYAFPLLSALIAEGINVDFIGSDALEKAGVERYENANFLNLRGDQNHCAPIREKILRILKYYFELIKYAVTTDSKLFHILWLNKFIHFDRTILNMFYKLLGKKLVFTAHNVNQGERDGNDSLINRLTLKVMYGIVDHIFVHTYKMKLQLVKDFNVRGEKITVIPFGINNFVPKSGLTRGQAKQRLQLGDSQKSLLFFGQVAPYKGLEYLILALGRLKAIQQNDVRLIVAGRVKEGHQRYWEKIQSVFEEHNVKDNITFKTEYIPDEDVEIYFKGADVLVLPYRSIFQTGLLFLAYNFGLPVIATDVGSLREDVIEGDTGFICQPENPEDLARKIELYFNSALFKNLEKNRQRIIEWANERYSWEKIGRKTCAVYRHLL